MENTLLGVGLTIVIPFGVLGLASLARKLGMGEEESRKLVHILLSNWVLLAIAVYRSVWGVCILPACFILLNYLSYRKGIFPMIERKEDNSLGTVWYAVSLFLLCFAGYSMNMPWIAACGMLGMGYGDGLGALVGKRWGKLRFPNIHSSKSLEGTFTVMLCSGLAVWIVCAAYAPNLNPNFALYAALASSVPAAAIELFTPFGLDNLTLPLGISFIVFLVAQYPFVFPIFLCLDIELLILILAYYAQAITLWAFQAAALLGILLFIFSGWLCFAALILFFLLGSAVSRVGKARKADAYTLHEHKGPRSVVQVVANGLPALIFAAFYSFTNSESFLFAVFVCLAAAMADTFSSEIGMLSKKEPVSILTLKPIQRGISGGVTLLGLGGSIAGAFIISIFALPNFGIKGILAAAAAGAASSIVDSVLGAKFQAKYRLQGGARDKYAHQLTEQKCLDGRPLDLVHGLTWVNNDVVNFVSILVCGLFSAILW